MISNLLLSPSDEERFWKMVDRTSECWNWLGPTDRNDRPVFPLPKHRPVSAVWLSYALAHGPVSGRIKIEQTCGTDGCVNPEHLRARTVEQRLLENAEWTDDGHLLWMGYVERGYGLISVNGKDLRVHRLMYELVHGPIPSGKCVRHTCDVRNCLRWDHLVLGTIGDNNRDTSRRGRTNPRRGDAHRWTKLSDADVIEVRRRAKNGESVSDLASEYGMSVRYLSDIVAGRARKRPSRRISTHDES